MPFLLLTHTFGKSPPPSSSSSIKIADLRRLLTAASSPPASQPLQHPSITTSVSDHASSYHVRRFVFLALPSQRSTLHLISSSPCRSPAFPIQSPVQISRSSSNASTALLQHQAFLMSSLHISESVRDRFALVASLSSASSEQWLATMIKVPPFRCAPCYVQCQLTFAFLVLCDVRGG